MFLPGIINGLLPVREFTPSMANVQQSTGLRAIRATTHPLRGTGCNMEISATLPIAAAAHDVLLLLTPYCSLLLLTAHYLLLTMFTAHCSLLTAIYCLLPYCPLLTAHWPLFAVYRLLASCHSLLATGYLLLATYCLLLTANCLPLTTYYSLLTTHYLTTHYVLLTGAAYCLLLTGGNVDDILAALEQNVGLAADLSPLTSQPSVHPPESVVVIAYSKGMTDLLAFLFAHPEWQPKIKAVFSWAGVVGGSPLADNVFRSVRDWPIAQVTK